MPETRKRGNAETRRGSGLITSTQNPLVKRIRSLVQRDARETEGRFVVEGIRMLEEALDAGAQIELILFDHGTADARILALRDRAEAAGARLVPASSRVVEAASLVETPQGVLAVVEAPRASLDAILRARDLLLVVTDRLQDPGNLGTIIRIADAAGASGVVVTRGSVDPLNPKTVRATMGSLFHLPVIETDAVAVHDRLKAAGARILVADQAGAIDYADVDYRPPAVVVLGNEGSGPDPLWRSAADATVRIPLYGRAESLNVAVAAGLLLYEARRARREIAEARQ